MAEVKRFFNGVSYTANDMNNDFYNQSKKIDGIIVSTNNDNNDLLHSAAATYQSTVKAGVAWKSGVHYENTSDLTLNHDAVTNTYKRIDRIVIRVDTGAGTFALTVLKGVETTGSASAPAITAGTDVQISQVLIDNTSGTPVYTITDERAFIFYSDSKKFYTTADLTLSGVYSDLEIYVNSGSARTINISAGAVCNNSGSGAIISLFPKAFVKNIGAGTTTLRIKSGGTGIGYDITLLQNEWVLLHWDSLGWFIVADDFSTDKKFVITATGAGNHTVPAGRRSLKVIVTGGGASGARSATNSGSGGGAGGTCIGYLTQLTPVATIAYTNGAGGATRTTDGQNAGSNSVFNTTFIGNGASAGPPFSLGGVASGGSINITGGDGQRPASWFITPTHYFLGGTGGASFWGSGGHGGAETGGGGGDLVGIAGAAYGSGGGGSCLATNAGAGANGIIVILYGNA